jgi:hypothetical protein
MAIRSGFFNSDGGDRLYNAEDISNFFEGLVSDGVYEDVDGAYLVRAGYGMTVTVQPGRAIVGGRWIRSDAVETLSISAASPVLHRYTAIILRLNLEARTIVLTTKDGEQGSAPNKPIMTRNSTVWEMCLAYVYVPKGSTQIYQSNITDSRPDSNVCGWVTGLINQVNTADLFLQWQSKYQEFYESFQSWFETLTSELQVNTQIEEFRKVATGTAQELASIELDMTGYTYEDSDIISVYINGLMAIPDEDYTITDGTVTLTGITQSASDQNKVFVRVLKSRIGDPVGGGSRLEQLQISDASESTSTVTEGEGN